MPEQFALDHAFGHRRAIDHLIGLLTVLALLMDGPREHAFAGPRLTGNEHGRTTLGGFRDEAQDFLERLTCPREIGSHCFVLRRSLEG